MPRTRVFPISRSDALNSDSGLYIDAGGACYDCGTASPLRYTSTKECRNCVREGSMAAFGSDPLDVWGHTTAMDRGLPGYFIENTMCARGPHLKMFSVSSKNICLICQAEKRAKQVRDHGLPRASRPVGRPAGSGSIDQRTAPAGIPRGLVHDLGFQFYTSEKPCKYGHVAPRIMTGGCLQCLGKWAPVPPPMLPTARSPDADDPNDHPIGLLNPDFVAYVPKRKTVSLAPPPPVEYTHHPDGSRTYKPRAEVVRPGEHVVTVSQERAQRRSDAVEEPEEHLPPPESDPAYDDIMEARAALLAARGTGS